jgi:putative ABC transport system permease protein
VSELSKTTVRLCAGLLQAAAPLAPADLRRDWFREWLAELHHAAARIANQRRSRQASHAWLVLRCSGAVVHAAWLRWDRWRFEMLVQDLKYAVRMLVKRPGFATMTVLTLALGIGANAAIFSAVRAVLLRPLPFPAPDRIVQVFSTTVTAPDRLSGTASPPDFTDWRRDSRSFAELAALNADSLALTGHGAAEQLSGAYVTGGFFNVLGVPAHRGRTLTPEDDAPSGPNVAVLAYSLWVRRFGSDPQIIGRTISLEGNEARVVGVMPRSFEYPQQSEVWVPLRFSERDLATQRGAHYLDVIGRLKEGVALGAAREEMRALSLRTAEAYPSTNRNNRISVHEMRTAMVGDFRPALLMLLGAVGFVLLIVCVNVANLVLTRALGRTRELAIRNALGAGRVRLVRGVLVESLLLSVLGAAAGLALAVWVSQGIAALHQTLSIPLLDETRVDGVVVGFTVVVSVIVALLFGSLPAWHTSSVGDLAARIREDSGNATGDRHRQRLRSTLIVAETALAVVLLVGAGLLLRSFLRMTSVELGFDVSRVQTFNVSLPDMKYQTPAQRAEFVNRLVSRASAQPGVEAAGAIFGLPLTNFRYVISMSTLDGRRLSDDDSDARSLQVRVVTPGYFDAMRIPVVRGRSLGEGDRAGAAPSVVVNERAATLLWPDENPIGHQFTLGTRLGQEGVPAGGTVVGVAGNVRDHGPMSNVPPTVYLAHAQFPVAFMTLAIRTRGEPTAVTEPMRAVLAELDPDVPMFSVRTMEQRAASAVARPRVYLMLLSLFAGTAILLAALGIYGVLMHAVAQRTREIGIRLALGARRSEVVRMVVQQAALLALAGLTLGLSLAFGASRLIRSLLFGVEPSDAVTYGAVALGLLWTALLASYLPARRASRIDPVRALRYE